MRPILRLSALCLALSLYGAAAAQNTGPPLPPAPGAGDDRAVPGVIVPGRPSAPVPASVGAHALQSGDISLNFPNADVHDAARAILVGMLALPYSPDPSLKAQVTVVTGRPIPRGEVLAVFQAALKATSLALIRRGNTYTILRLADAQHESQMVGGQDLGFGNETIQLQFVNADQMKRLLDQLLPNNGVSQVDSARNVVVVSGDESGRKAVRELVRQFDVNWLRGMSFALFTPQRTDSRLITPELERLLNGQGSPTAGLVRLISMDRLHGILAISAQPQYLEDVRRWIEILDREGESAEPRLFVYRVQNGRSSDLGKVLLGALGGSIGQTAGAPGTTPAPAPGTPTTAAPPPPSIGGSMTGDSGGSSQPVAPSASTSGSPSIQFGEGTPATITSDDANNAIVVFATPRQYAIIEDALRKLDVVPVQVEIEAAITEVQLNKNLSYGVQWLFQHGNSQFGFSNGLNSIPTRVYPGFSYLFAGDNITATLNALGNVTKIRVLSAPKLMVLNNQTASLQVGDQVPVATESSVSTISAGAPVVNSIEYRDTGVILKVTPRVNSNGLVLLDISQEVSDVVKTSSSTINSPTISERKISSSIAVYDGHMIALGGLIKENHTDGRGGIPGLSALPVVGALFGQRDDENDRTELLVLLTPRVIRTVEDATAVTEDLRARLHDADTPPAVETRR